MPELVYRNLIVGLVPQPQIPTPSLGQEELQRAFFDVTRGHQYQQFALVGDGANFVNGPEDVVVVQPGLIQIATPIGTKERTREKAVEVLSAVAERTRMQLFVQCGIKVVATVPLPGNADAVEFMGRLMGGRDRATELGERFFDAGIKYRAITEAPAPREENLLIEPFVSEPTSLWLSYDVQRLQTVENVETVSPWLDEAFRFIEERAIAILEV